MIKLGGEGLAKLATKGVDKGTCSEGIDAIMFP